MGAFTLFSCSPLYQPFGVTAFSGEQPCECSDSACYACAVRWRSVSFDSTLVPCDRVVRCCARRTLPNEHRLHASTSSDWAISSGFGERRVTAGLGRECRLRRPTLSKSASKSDVAAAVLGCRVQLVTALKSGFGAIPRYYKHKRRVVSRS